MVIPAIPPIGAGVGAAGFRPAVGAPQTGGQDFSQMVKDGLQSVSNAEAKVDSVSQNIAAGGPAEIHDLMAASAKAQIQVDLLVQMRNRAVEAYQEIMRIQV